MSKLKSFIENIRYIIDSSVFNIYSDGSIYISISNIFILNSIPTPITYDEYEYPHGWFYLYLKLDLGYRNDHRIFKY